MHGMLAVPHLCAQPGQCICLSHEGDGGGHVGLLRRRLHARGARVQRAPKPIPLSDQLEQAGCHARAHRVRAVHKQNLSAVGVSVLGL